MDSLAEPAAKPARELEPAALGLEASDLLEMYRRMVLSRVLDERMWALNRQGRAPFTISCQGHEAAQVGTARALRPGQDVYLPYYRDLGVVLSAGLTPREVMLAFFARAADPASGGRQMPNHFGHPERRILTGSSPVATQVPHAAGAALAARLRGEDSVAAVYLGEGSTSQGDFHEGLNFAGVHRLPVVVVVEDNGWAISVPRRRQMAVATVAERAAAYGFPGVVVDGLDVLASYAAMRAAVERARRGDGPTLLDARVCRLTPHSSDDDDRRYRSPDELAEARQQDPLDRFRRYLQARGLLDDPLADAVRTRAVAEVDDAVEFAERSPLPRPETLRDHVYAQDAVYARRRRVALGELPRAS